MSAPPTAPTEEPGPIQLLVLAKEPLPGRAKTRLTPPLSPDEAAAVARAALLDTLETVDALPPEVVVERVVVLDGSPDGWLPRGWQVRPQVPGGLAERLDAAFTEAFAASTAPVLLVGMDTPQVTPHLLRRAVATLGTPGTDAVLGLADDGGWWALGLRRAAPGAFAGVPMSTDRTGAAQLARLQALGRATVLLDRLRDVDHVDDLAAVAAQQPPTARVAALVAQLGLVPA